MAQYMAAIFVFSPNKTLKNIIFDLNLFYIIIATFCVVASGYIINNFYDVKVDRINRPLKTNLDNYVAQATRLKLYFTLNFIGFVFGLLISFRAALFFSIYIFGIWLYSHKLKKHPLTGLISATTLTILPFFAVFIYFKNFSKIIFIHAIFLFLIIMLRELVKDLLNIKGALINNYDTFPIVYGEKKTKQLSILLLILTIFPIAILLSYPSIGYMKYYFCLSIISLTFLGFYLWRSKETYQYRILHNFLKVLLLVGIFSLIFIDSSLIIDQLIKKLY